MKKKRREKRGGEKERVQRQELKKEVWYGRLKRGAKRTEGKQRYQNPQNRKNF